MVELYLSYFAFLGVYSLFRVDDMYICVFHTLNAPIW